MDPSIDPWQLIANDRYAEKGYPHDLWTRLRSEAPVYYCAPGADVAPFFAITKYDDIAEISRRPDKFIIRPRMAIFPGIIPPESAAESPARHLLNMDPPDHGIFRKIASAKFTPRAVRPLTDAVGDIAERVITSAGIEGENEFDFVEKIAAPFPLQVLARLLGVPREDWSKLFRWTNETVGASDPEYQQEGEDPNKTAKRARLELFAYFQELAEARRAQPEEDLVSTIANSEPYGKPIPPFEMLSYFYLVVVAGNETTRNALAGGLMTLAQHPDQWEQLRKDLSLLDSAVEEILRWTSPVIQFTRTATEDYLLRGVKIAKGESVCLFYPSANRDEEIFDAPFAFRIDREPNRHLAFGIGEHFCLGANLARLELRVLLRELLSRWDRIEVTGTPRRLQSSFVGGIKHLPLRVGLA